MLTNIADQRLRSASLALRAFRMSYSKNRIYIILIMYQVLISDSKNDLYARLKRGHSSIVPFTDAVVPPLYFIFEK